MKNLINQLREIANLEPDQFRSRSYARAARALSSLTEEQFNDRKSFIDLPGIGKSINSKIMEYKSKGVITKLISLRNEQVNYLNPEEYKIRKSYISKKITNQEAKTLFNEVNDYLCSELSNKGFDAPISYSEMIAGSLRRNKRMIGDLDVLVHDNIYDSVVNILSDKYELLVSGDEKASFKLNNPEATQLDVVRVNKVDAPFKLLYLTGSKEFNIMMRSIAKRKGLTLNQYGLFNDKERIPGLDTEISIFEYLGMEYVKPEDR